MSAMRASFAVVRYAYVIRHDGTEAPLDHAYDGQRPKQTVLADAFVRRLHGDLRCDVDMHRIEQRPDSLLRHPKEPLAMKTPDLYLASRCSPRRHVRAAAQHCTLKLTGDDKMQFDLKTATVSASCPEDHRRTHARRQDADRQRWATTWSSARTADMRAVVGRRRVKARLAAAGYVAKGDPKIIAATSGPSVGMANRDEEPRSPAAKLKAGGEYMFLLRVPGGHTANK
jgi:azurin